MIAAALSLPPASPDRVTHAVRPPRPVIVHLTSFAPRCADRSVGAAERNRTFWNKTPEVVIRALCKRLAADPADLEARTAPAEVEIVRRSKPTEVLALIWDGLTVAEANSVLAEHQLKGWSPAADAPPR